VAADIEGRAKGDWEGQSMNGRHAPSGKNPPHQDMKGQQCTPRLEHWDEFR